MILQPSKNAEFLSAKIVTGHLILEKCNNLDFNIAYYVAYPVHGLNLSKRDNCGMIFQYRELTFFFQKQKHIIFFIIEEKCKQKFGYRTRNYTVLCTLLVEASSINSFAPKSGGFLKINTNSKFLLLTETKE